MPFKDLREWLEAVDGIGQLSRIKGAHWDQEITAVCSLTDNIVLFDEIAGYPRGYRVLAPATGGSLSRFFITSNWQTQARGLALTRDWLKRLREFQPIPPKWVEGGPIVANIQSGDEVDVLKFPVPKRHEKEGGRYIGTGHTVVLRDPETGRINLGTYRIQVHNRNTLGFHASEGKDGRIIMDKYHALGLACPVVAVVGVDPGIFFASTYSLVHEPGATELEFVGWMKGQPEEIMAGKFTGLPIPANAEIALEGEIPPGTTLPEGPFAEWTGYCQVQEQPVIRVKAVYHRHDPILTVAPGSEFHPRKGMRADFKTSALIWDQLERAGIRGIRGVAAYNSRRLIVVSIKNLYAGHSQQAGQIAAQCHAGAYGGTYVIVVDDKVDPTNIQEVLWQVVMRTEPKKAIQILQRGWASHLAIQDPSYVQEGSYALRGKKATYISKAVIDACVPLEWDPTWHGEIHINPEVMKKVRQKYEVELPASQRRRANEE